MNLSYVLYPMDTACIVGGMASCSVNTACIVGGTTSCSMDTACIIGGVAILRYWTA